MENCEIAIEGSDAYNTLVNQMRKRHRLYSVQWELTHRCNEICAHCYLDVKSPGAKPLPGEAQELDTDECRHVIDQLAAAGVLNLTLTGGEMMVRKDWLDIATYARSKRMLLRLFSNGIMINAKLADQIAALGPYIVEISVYGANAATHEMITRQRGTFNLTLRALSLLRERGVRTMMKTPIMHQNVHEFHAMRKLAEDMGAGYRWSTTMSPSVNPLLNPAHFRMTDEDLHWYMLQTENASYWDAHEVSLDQTTCGIGGLSLLIDPYGTVYPCVEVRQPAGNLRTSSLRSIWETSPLLADVRGLTLNELPDCRTCDLVKFCTRCHGMALNLDGDMRRASSENCREARIRKNVVMELTGKTEEKQETVAFQLADATITV